MKLPRLLLALSLSAAPLLADTLTADTAVFQQPDPQSPVIAQLKRGTTVATAGEAPVGWSRVEVTGAFEGFVHTRDITKSLDVREGASILAAPDRNAAQLTVAQSTDKTEITGLRGDYCQVKVTKTLQGFIALGEIANRPATPSRPNTTLAPVTPPSVQSNSSTAVGRSVPAQNAAELPRLFSGTLVVARRPLINPNPPYDYQLTDLNGRRFAYVDTKRLVLTNKIDSLVDKIVTVTGTVRNTVDGRDLVIVAESMQAK
jgi:hypothetical protein